MKITRKNECISGPVIRRLPRYYRFLEELIDEGTYKISSKVFAERLGLTPSQVRQDFNCFGCFGLQGYGYNVEILRDEIADILGIKSKNKIVIIGAGNIGTAICKDSGFAKRGCIFTGIFDNNPALYGKKVAEFEIKPMEELSDFCTKTQPLIAALCVPKEAAESICEELIGLGVKSFWNFTHFDVKMRFDSVNVENVHLGDSLMTLVYSANR